MKAYEILPPSMTGNAMDGGIGAKKPKPYEILPEAGAAAQGLGGKSGGCGCGGSCGGGDRGQSVNASLAAGKWSTAAAFPAVSAGIMEKRSATSATLPTGALQLGPGQSPGASLCAALGQEIEDLRAELSRRYMQYGPRLPDVRNAVEASQRLCNGNSSNLSDLCSRLNLALAAAQDGRTASGLFHLANMCSCALPFALPCGEGVTPLSAVAGGAETARILGCLLARQAIDRIEQDIERQRQMSLQWHYRYDIAPMEDSLRALEAQLRDCEQSNISPSGFPGDCTTDCRDWMSRGYVSCARCCSHRCNNQPAFVSCCTTNCGYRGCDVGG